MFINLIPVMENIWYIKKRGAKINPKKLFPVLLSMENFIVFISGVLYLKKKKTKTILKIFDVNKIIPGS